MCTPAPRVCCLPMPACEDTMLSDQPYRYLTVDEMKSLGDDSLPIDVTRDERMDSNKEATAAPLTAADDGASPQHVKETYAQYAASYAANYTPDNVDLQRHPVHVGFLVSFLVDARGGAMRGCRHSGVRVIVPPRCAPMPTRVTCRYLKRDKLAHPPPLMEGEALASRILELGPVGAKFLGPVVIEVPHFGSLRGAEREIVVLRSDNGETWREHVSEAGEDAIRDVLHDSFEGEELAALEEASPGRSTRVLTSDFPQYLAIVSRVRQEVHAIGPEGGMVSSSVVPQVQAVFPQGALTKKIKVGLQAQPIPAELTAKLLGNRVAVSPIVTVEPRRRKFHKPITLTIPVPQAANKGMINQYSGDAPTLRLLCSITGGTTRAQWEDVTGSTPLTFVNDCVSFTTTVSARFWLMDCRNIAEATKMATELYKEAIHVPFMAKFVVFAKRVDALEARLRVFCMTDDKEDKTLEHQEHFTEVAKSRDVEVLEGKPQFMEFAGNLVPVTKSGEQLQLGFRAFRENRLPFTARVKDPHADTVGRVLFMREPKVPKGEPPQQPVCILNIVLPETIVPESGVSEPDMLALQSKYRFLRDGVGRADATTRASLRLTDISNLLGDEWVALALQLGLTTSDVNVIKSQQPGGAHQALAMLRLWLRTAGNKANSNTLEAALRKVGRDDIVQRCIFNTEAVERAVARVRADQAGFDALKEELGPSREASLRRDQALLLDAAALDQDIMKESESVEELMQAEKKEPRKDEAPLAALAARAEKLGLEQKSEDERERDETKYIGEEKEVPEAAEGEVVHEERRSVAELKQLFAQDKRDRQYERQPRAPAGAQEDDEAETKPGAAAAVAAAAAAEAERRDSALFEGVSQELARLDTAPHDAAAPETVLSPKVSKTPPPSPAEFKDTAGGPAWQPGAVPATGPQVPPPECTVRPCADEETGGGRAAPASQAQAAGAVPAAPRPAVPGVPVGPAVLAAPEAPAGLVGAQPPFPQPPSLQVTAPLHEQEEQALLEAQRQEARRREHAMQQAQALAEQEERDRLQALEEQEEMLKLEAEMLAKALADQEERIRLDAEKQAKALAEQEEKARIEAEKRARVLAEQEEKARKDAEKQAKALAEQEEMIRLEAEKHAKALAEQEEMIRLEAEKRAKALAEQEEKARLEAEKQAKALAEQEEKARLEAEKQAKALAEQEEKARLEAEKQAKALAEQEEKGRLEAEKQAKALAEQEEKARLEAEKQAKALAEQEEKARLEAEKRAKALAEQEEKARLEAEKQAKALVEQEEKARLEAEKQAKALAEQEEKARLEAEKQAKALAEQEEKARLEAEKQAKALAEQEERIRLEAEKEAKSLAIQEEIRLESDKLKGLKSEVTAEVGRHLVQTVDTGFETKTQKEGKVLEPDDQTFLENKIGHQNSLEKEVREDHETVSKAEVKILEAKKKQKVAEKEKSFAEHMEQLAEAMGKEREAEEIRKEQEEQQKRKEESLRQERERLEAEVAEVQRQAEMAFLEAQRQALRRQELAQEQKAQEEAELQEALEEARARATGARVVGATVKAAKEEVDAEAQAEPKPIVTTPTSRRRGLGLSSASARAPADRRPRALQVSALAADDDDSDDVSPGEEDYIVTEPVEQQRRAVFRLESEEDEMLVRSGVTVTDLDAESDDCADAPSAPPNDLPGLDVDAAAPDDAVEKKLRRVERRFERMASETLASGAETAEAGAGAAEEVSPGADERRREAEFQRMLSQLSTEEVAAGDAEYAQLWDEGGLTLTPSEEWDSGSARADAAAPDTPSGALDVDLPADRSPPPPPPAEDEDDATLPSLESAVGGVATATSTTTTTTSRDVDGSTVTTVTRVTTEQRSSGVQPQQ